MRIYTVHRVRDKQFETQLKTNQSHVGIDSGQVNILDPNAYHSHKHVSSVKCQRREYPRDGVDSMVADRYEERYEAQNADGSIIQSLKCTTCYQIRRRKTHCTTQKKFQNNFLTGLKLVNTIPPSTPSAATPLVSF